MGSCQPVKPCCRKSLRQTTAWTDGAADGCWAHKHQPAARAGLLPGAASLRSISVPVIDDPDALRCEAGRVAGDGPDPPLIRLVQTADQHVLSARAQGEEIRALHHVGAAAGGAPGSGSAAAETCGLFRHHASARRGSRPVVRLTWCLSAARRCCCRPGRRSRLSCTSSPRL